MKRFAWVRRWFRVQGLFLAIVAVATACGEADVQQGVLSEPDSETMKPKGTGSSDVASDSPPRDGGSSGGFESVVDGDGGASEVPTDTCSANTIEDGAIVNTVYVRDSLTCFVLDSSTQCAGGSDVLGLLSFDGVQEVPVYSGSVTQLAVATDHACFAGGAENVACWGNHNGYWQLGSEERDVVATVDKPFVVDLPETVLDLALGTQVTCVATAGSRGDGVMTRSCGSAN